MKDNKRTGKKSKCLGQISALDSAGYLQQPIETKVELIKALIPIGLLAVQQMLEEEVTCLAGERYSREGDYYRHGSNPGSVKLAGQRHAIRVPRLRNRAAEEVSLSSWQGLKGSGEVDEVLLRRVLYGISCRNYEAASESLPGAIGLSKSSVSRGFTEASRAQLKAFHSRDLSSMDLVALFLDGKSFAQELMVIALGVTLSGEKIPLGFVQTGTENGQTLTLFLRELMDRGLDVEHGLLVIIDGAKGLRSAVINSFGNQAMIQRCQWHKRENIVSYLPKSQQGYWRRRLQKAYEKPTYKEAKRALKALRRELGLLNESAVASLDEGFEETLTLHRLGVFALLGISLKTTNCLESLNAQVEARCGKVKRWRNSNQKHRWLASALIDIEPLLRKIRGCKHLDKLRNALKQELKLHEQVNKKAA